MSALADLLREAGGACPELKPMTEELWRRLARALLTRRRAEDLGARTGTELREGAAIFAARARLLAAAACPTDLPGCLTDLGLEGLAAALGRRATPTTIIGAAGLPPPRAHLLRAAAELGRGGLSAAARARDKHAARGPSRLWPPALGSVARKNREAAALIAGLIEAAVDWNLYRHGALGPVYELRLPGGHGARWSGAGDRFIGLIEPFEAP